VSGGMSIGGKQPVAPIAHDGSTCVLVAKDKPVRKTLSRYFRENLNMGFRISARLLIRQSEICQPPRQQV
jgi:hypothetical protein